MTDDCSGVGGSDDAYGDWNVDVVGVVDWAGCPALPPLAVAANIRWEIVRLVQDVTDRSH